MVIPTHRNYIVESFATPEWASATSAHFEVLGSLAIKKPNCSTRGTSANFSERGTERRSLEQASTRSTRPSASTRGETRTRCKPSRTSRECTSCSQMASSGSPCSNSEEEVERAKLTLFSRLDGPRVAHNSGLRHFLFGITPEMNQQRRAQLLKASKADLLEVLNTRMMADIESEKSGQMIFGVNQQDLQFFVTRGWVIERFIEILAG